MANIYPIPYLRNQNVYQDIATAKQALEAQKGNVSDGIAVAARYYDNNVIKTLLGVFYSSGNTKTVSFLEDSAEVISAITSALTIESNARKAVDGINGDAYSANTSATYISGATSLNDADQKLDAAVKGNKIVQGNGVTVTPSATGTTVDAKAATNSTSGIVNPITVDGDGIKFATYLDAGEY